MNEIESNYISIITGSPLFAGLPEAAYKYALGFFNAHVMHYPKGELIKRSGDRMISFGLVLRGSVLVYADDINGNRMVMASVGPGQTFGESLCYLKTSSPVYIRADAKTSVLLMDTTRVFDPSASERLDLMLSSRFTSMLAARTLCMNSRIQILSKLTIREKLITFFSQQPGASLRKPFNISMDREDLAAYLGTNRSALSRELSNMKKEGILDYYRNTFRML